MSIAQDDARRIIDAFRAWVVEQGHKELLSHPRYWPDVLTRTTFAVMLGQASYGDPDLVANAFQAEAEAMAERAITALSGRMGEQAQTTAMTLFRQWIDAGGSELFPGIPPPMFEWPSGRRRW